MAKPKSARRCAKGNTPPPPDPPAAPPMGEEPTIDPAALALDFLIQGANRAEAIAALKKVFPGVDADAALDQALDLAAGTVHTPPEILFGLAHLKLIDLHQQLRSTGDFSGAVGATKASIQLAKYTSEKFGAKPHRARRKGTGTHADGPIELFEL